jgi:hypothetical protein
MAMSVTFSASTVAAAPMVYHATNPQFLSREQAGPLLKAAFSPIQRAGTLILGVRQFLSLQAMRAEA